MKKVLMIFLSIALIFTMAAPAFAANGTVADKFAELKAAGILDGAGDAGSMPDVSGTMTREQLAKIAVNLAGLEPTPNVNIPAFAGDYKIGVWGFEQGWIQAAYNADLMKGKGAEGFVARGTVTIAELLTVVLRAAGFGSELDNDNWKASAISVATAHGFITGTVNPDNLATYGDLVGQAYNAYQTIANAAELKVLSITSANAKEAKITFSKAVDAGTVVSGTALQNITITPVGSAPAITVASAVATLSADGKVVTIVPQTTEGFNGDYVVTATNLIKEKGAPTKALVPYSAIANLKDTVKPAVASVTYPAKNVARITFTEPVNVTVAQLEGIYVKHLVSGGTPSLSGKITLAADQKSFDINTAPPTFLAALPAPFEAWLVGIADFAGNLINPNPTKIAIDHTAQDDKAKPSLVNIEGLGVGAAKITFSEKMDTSTMKIKIDAGADVDLTIGVNASVDSTGTIVTTNGIAGLTGTVKVTVTAKDIAGNSLTNGQGFPVNYKFVTFTPDTTSPKYVSNSIATISGINYLLVKFDENVAYNAGPPAGTYVDASSITHSVTLTGAVTQHVVAPATQSDTVKIVLSGLNAGTYNVVLPAAFVKDVSTNTNSSLQAAMTFTVGTQLDPAVPVATIGAIQTSEDTVVVTFDKDVTAATALNVANYTVDGRSVFTSAIFMGDAKTVHLKLAASAITMSGNYQFEIANVATAAGKVMVPVKEVKVFKENVKPTFTKAALATVTTITATFSEAIASGSDNAFEVYKDGVKVAVTHTFAAGATATITLADAIVLTSTYTVKFVGTDLKDAVGNTAVSGNTVTMTQ